MRWPRCILGMLALGMGLEIWINPAMAEGVSPSSLPTPGQNQPTPSGVELTLDQVIQLVVQQNRDLKNAALDRIIQRQQLRAAESKFNPRWTPAVGVNLTHSLSPGRSVSGFNRLSENSQETTLSTPNLGLGQIYTLNQRTTLNRTVQLSGDLLTRIGTRFFLTVEPLNPQTFNLTVTQPLLRGFGRSVHEASVQTARLVDQKNQLTLRQTLIDKITETITAYRELIRDQEAVRIQERSLVSKQRQYEVIQALVQAGRRPQVDLVEAEQTIANTQRQLLQAQNALAQSNTNLLKLIDTSEIVQVRVAPNTIEQLVQKIQPNVDNLTIAAALETAYLHRPDYLQAKVDIATERLNLLVAKDNQRWQLDLQGNTSLGPTSQISTGLVLSRTFGDPNLTTAVVERQVGIQKNQNRLAQLTERIRQEIADELRNMQSGWQQIQAAEKARQFAEQQLEIAREKFKRGIGNTTIFEVLRKEDDVVDARNSELNARIDLLAAIVAVDQVLGTTLQTWNIPLEQ